MKSFKKVMNITTGKLLIAMAAFAPLMAVASQRGVCLAWLYQPKLPACLADTEE